MDYIDRDTAIRTATEICVKVVGHGITQIDAVNIADAFDDIPTDDVVPKSEVERLQAEKDALIKNYAECMKDYAREIFAEIESKKMFLKDCVGNMGVVVLFKDISELKKKYTEGNPSPAPEEKYFSPQDVRNMTPKEVHDNYSAIIKSIELWN